MSISENVSERKDSWLDRPVFGAGRVTWWTVAYAVVIVFILFTRLWDLGARGYDHDSSIHAWESWKLATGQGYIHSPVFHGPFGYHFTALIYTLFGDNDYTGRLGAALFGIALALLPLALKKWLGNKGTFATLVLMAISPVMMFRSRFFRHDPFVAAFNLMLFIAIVRYLSMGKKKDLYLAAAALSLGFTAKENTFITYFIFGTFIFALFLWQWLIERRGNWRELPAFDLIMVLGTLILPLASPFPIKLLGGDPVDYSSQAIMFSGAVFLGVLALSVALGLWWNWRQWLVCAGIFYVIFVPFFTTMFTNGQGIATGMVGSLGYWLSQHGVKRGDQPWFYYLVLVPMYEFLPLTLAFGGGVAYVVKAFPALIRPRRPQPEAGAVTAPKVADGETLEDGGVAERDAAVPFVPFLAYWFVVSFVVYSWAGEKMPWLTMHIALPLIIMAGWTLGRLLEVDWREVRARGGLLLLPLLPLFVWALSRVLQGGLSTNTTIEALGATMGWLGALVVAVALAVPAVRIVLRLGERIAWRMVALSLTVVLMGLTLRAAWMATFINYDYPTEFIVYAHGTPDTALVTRELEDMSRRLYGDLSMKVAYDDESSWPFVWYLRNFTNAQFYGSKPSGPFDAEVVIVGTANEASVKPLLGNRYYRRQYRLIWWPLQTWYNQLTPEKIVEELKNPEALRKRWDVIFNRKYDESVTAWPFVNNFAMYVRRDVAQQLWDYGPETAATTGELPGDEYLEKWTQRPAAVAWGMPGSGSGQFRSPKGIALDAEGNVYIADSMNHRVQVLDAQGQFLRQWGVQGVQPGQFNEPWGIAVSPDGLVYVTDTWNHRIQVFDQEGELQRAWGMFGKPDDPMLNGDLLYGPRDVVVDQEGYLYVTDTGNKRVIKYDADGQVVAIVGGEGSEDGQFQEPVGLALSADGEVYVADTWNMRVQVFDQNLNYVRQWSLYGWEGQSVVNKPYLAVDDAGNVYITDPEQYRILRFDKQGKLLSIWGQYGNDLSSMNLPTGIKVDSAGRVIVSDSENHRLLTFEGN
ncbi:MAG: TIGR03663 family protein [Chloroflexi bacterium]|jgi:uncharacterized protein (TIGR03663 family)|nr:TIGR03663 family protein [Chloroflexota bacterium]